MDVRRRLLRGGWYPDDEAGVRAALSNFEAGGELAGASLGSIAAVAPHAGWEFSGSLAWAAWRAAREAELAIVIGGHLPAGADFLCAPAPRAETPLGELELDMELDAFVRGELGARPDHAIDNTVEVQLPMLKARFPKAKAAWFRAPNGPEAKRLGLALARYVGERGIKAFALGSTDLTHYGPAYDWEPAGGGAAGREWAAESDRAIAEAYMQLDAERALALADERRASCSVGAAVAAMAFAYALGSERGELLGITNSAARAGGPSFVGYCAVAYAPGG